MKRYLFGLLIAIILVAAPSFALDSQDSQIFITGFNAYQKKEYQTAVDKMTQVLKNYPESQLRDMALFWLARANFKAGNQKDAARYMAQFFREYPDNPLKGTVEDELVSLATAYAKDDKARVAAEKADAERVAKESAEIKRLAQEKAESERLASEDAAREKAEAEQKRLAMERSAAEKASEEKAARIKVAAEEAAREKAVADRLIREKADSERAAQERAIAEERRVAAKKAAVELSARAKADADRAAAEKSLLEKAEAERIATEKAEADRIAKLKIEDERKRLLADKAAADKAAMERTAQERSAREKAVQDKAAAERLAKAKAESERAARLNAEAEQSRLESEKAAAAKLAEAKAGEARTALRKVEAERQEREKAENEQKRIAAEKAAGDQKRLAAEKRLAARSGAKRKTAKPVESARDRSIAEYRAIIDRAPGSSSAEASSAKLKAMGVDYPATGSLKPASVHQPPATAQVLNLEVGQFADVEFNVGTAGQAFPVGRRIVLPFEVQNRGNGNDSFYLESGFPAEYGVQFVAEDKPEVPVNLTPQLSPGQRFKGALALTIPRGTIDGQKISYPVKLASQYAKDISQSRQVTFIASAPLLRAVINTDRKEVAPGEKVTYRVALLNIGSAAAGGVMLRLNYPPLYEPVDFIKSGFKQEMKAALVLDGLKLESGESKELTVTFQLKDEALARQELFLRGDLINQEMETSDSFVSALALVQGISGVIARTTAEKLVVIPGQTVTIPLIVNNTGNQREDFGIQLSLPASLTYTLYQDLNRDGIRQPNEPAINHVGPLAAREEAYVVLELKTPASEGDGSSMPLSVSFEPESDRKKGAIVNLKIAYSRPVVELTMTGRGGRLRPGEVATFDLNCINRGSSIAKVVDMQTVLPEALELVASDPAVSRGRGGEYIWKFEELGAGEKKGARVSFRVKSGVAVGTNLQVKNLLRYQDQLGNSY